MALPTIPPKHFSATTAIISTSDGTALTNQSWPHTKIVMILYTTEMQSKYLLQPNRHILPDITNSRSVPTQNFSLEISPIPPMIAPASETSIKSALSLSMEPNKLKMGGTDGSESDSIWWEEDRQRLLLRSICWGSMCLKMGEQSFWLGSRPSQILLVSTSPVISKQ